MAIDIKRAIQLADKYVRKKDYRCLFPGCNKKAIRSHAIPRASLIEAIAQNGVLYTINQSYTTVYRKTSPHDPMEIVAVGVNKASVFRGFCQEHDTKLFAPVETTDEQKKKGVMTSLHLRALALEHCRKRRSVDLFKKLIEFDLPTDVLTVFRQGMEDYKKAASYTEFYLRSVFFPQFQKNPGQIDYFCIPFSKNLNVSCCGVFNHNDLSPTSVIAYNILSYKDMSFLALTTFGCEHATLDSFISDYRDKGGIERMVNDIAFLLGEEPLISPQLWEALNDSEKGEIGLCLVHPAYRFAVPRPRIIKICPGDLLKEITPSMVTRLGHLSPV
jgi:hypothetical protein